MTDNFIDHLLAGGSTERAAATKIIRLQTLLEAVTRLRNATEIRNLIRKTLADGDQPTTSAKTNALNGGRDAESEGMSPQERAMEFCIGAFGPLGVDVAPYAKIIAELIEGAISEERAEIERLRAAIYNCSGSCGSALSARETPKARKA